MKIPTKETIEWEIRMDAVRQIHHKLLHYWVQIDEFLYSEFQRLSKNIDQRDVAYKVAILNGLYDCGLRMDLK
jgi:hypothetical protein